MSKSLDLSTLKNDLNLARKSLEIFDAGRKCYYNNRDQITSIISRLERQIRETEIDMEVELIKPYLSTQDVNLDITDGEALFFRRAKLGDKIYLEYMVGHKVEDSDDLSKQRGVVIFDKTGNLLFNYIYRYTPKDSFPKGLVKGKKIYRGVKPSKVFLDENNFILDTSVDPDYPRQVHYRMKNGRFREANQFIEASLNMESGRHDPDKVYYFSMLEVAGKDKLGTYGGRLYSISKGTYLNYLEFEKIYDRNIDEDDILPLELSYPEALETFAAIMKENNLLLGVTTFKLDDNSGDKDRVTTFVYLDTNGNIVSDLSYYPKFSRSNENGIDSKLKSVTVTTDTYEEALKEVAKRALEDKKELLEKEKRLSDLRTARYIARAKKHLALIANSYKKEEDK